MAFTRLRKLHRRIIATNPDYSQVGQRKGLFCATEWRTLLNFDFNVFYQKYILFTNGWIEGRKNYVNSFYCMLCDAKNHAYFDTTEMKITISQQFCKNFLVDNQDDIIYWINEFFKYVRNFQNVVDCNHYTHAFNMTFFNREKLKESIQGTKCLRNLPDNFGPECRYLCSKIGLASTTSFLDGDPAFIEEIVNLFDRFNFNQERGRFISLEMREYYKRFELVKTLNMTERSAFTQMINRAITPTIQTYDPVEFFQRNFPVARMMRLNAMKRKLLESKERKLSLANSRISEQKKRGEPIPTKAHSSLKDPSPEQVPNPYFYQKPSYKNSEFLKKSFVEKTNLIFQNAFDDNELLQNRRRLQSAPTATASTSSCNGAAQTRNPFFRTPKIQLNGYDTLVYDQILVEAKNHTNRYFYDILTQPLDVDKITRKFGSDAGVDMGDYDPVELIMDTKAFYEMLFKARQPDSWNVKLQGLLDSIYPTFLANMTAILVTDLTIDPNLYIINKKLGIGRKLKLNSKKNRKLIREISTV